MTSPATVMFGVPEPFSEEAPSSWISRLTLAQSCSLPEMLDFLDLSAGGDLDFELRGEALSELRRKCGLPPSAFAIAERVMTRIGDAGLRDEVLYMDPGGKPRFCFCPLCIKEGRPPAFSVYWRFVDWRYCPIHHCLMEKRCQICKMPVRYPQDMAVSRAGCDGHASQRRCQHCSADLAAVVPYVIHPDRMALTMREADWIQAGYQLIQALGEPVLRKWEPHMSSGKGLPPVGKSVPTAIQWHRFERQLRAGAFDHEDNDDGRQRCHKRRNWGAAIFGPFRERPSWWDDFFLAERSCP